MSAAHHLRPAGDGSLSVSAAEAGWRFLDAAVLRLDPGERRELEHAGRELAIVPIEGRVRATAARSSFELARTSVFSDPPQLLYLPPGEPVVVEALEPATVATGSAPAEGRYPLRLFGPGEMRAELRGGGAARRQVNHVLAAPLPAERLIVYEIVAPRGAWCGWPPHCHDGRDGSPYLEETYWFAFDRPEGQAIHRNYRADEGFDEVFVVSDGDLVLVTKGYHTTVAAPGTHLYFLNFLAGELRDGERARPPCFEAVHTWITDDWGAGSFTLPTGSAGDVSAR